MNRNELTERIIEAKCGSAVDWNRFSTAGVTVSCLDTMEVDSR
jgi:hypothetical protein